MSTPSPPSPYEALLSWARSHGAIIPETVLFLSTPYGYCQSTVPIPAGTALFHIPHSLLITPSVADHALPELHLLPVHARVCAFIALERRKDGFWKAYFEALPEKFDTPAWFTEEERLLLKGTNLFFAWRERVEIWREEFSDVCKIIPDINWYSSSTETRDIDLCRDDYLWAATVLSSRSFPSRLIHPPPPATADQENTTVIHEPPADAGSSDPILIPVMDMLNHRPNHPVTWLTQPTQISFIAETPYPPNTEIFNNYGAKGNEECTPLCPSPIAIVQVVTVVLMGYGFCLPDNPYDSLSLRLPNDPTLYTITRNFLAPENLLSKFCDVTILEREKALAKRTKRNLYAGYTALLNGLLQKLGILGWENRRFESSAGEYAEMYRGSQRELLVRAYEFICARLGEMVQAGEMVSLNCVVRGMEKERKKRKREVDGDEVMVGWIARVLQGVDTHDMDISPTAKRFLLSLGEYYKSSEEDEEEDGGLDEEARRIQKKLKKKGHEVDIQNIRSALQIWDEESIEIIRYPHSVQETIARLQEDEEALDIALRGESVDIVLFIDEIPEM